MNPHKTCGTCVHNVEAQCTCEGSRYHKAPLKPWNTCSTHKAPLPSTAALIDRLTVCAAALDHLAAKAVGDYKPYFGDRARQCRKWLDDLREGLRVDVEYIAGGLEEFEALAL